MEIKKFSEYLNLRESLSYPIKGIKDKDTLCEIPVIDITNNQERAERRSILFNNRGGLVSLSYINRAGEVLDNIEIPSNYVKIKRDKSGKVSCVIVDTYNDWDEESSGVELLDDFIEGFANYLKVRNGKTDETVRDDIEVILDILDIPGTVESIERTDKNEWEAKLKNNCLVNIKKRRGQDIMGSLKIYKTPESVVPSIHIEDLGKSKKSTFNFSGDSPIFTIEEPVGLAQLRSKNPYYIFLLKSCLDMASKKHQEDFIDHFSRELKSNSSLPDSQYSINDLNTQNSSSDAIERMEVALSTFLPKNEIEKIYFNNRN